MFLLLLPLYNFDNAYSVYCDRHRRDWKRSANAETNAILGHFVKQFDLQTRSMVHREPRIPAIDVD